MKKKIIGSFLATLMLFNLTGVLIAQQILKQFLMKKQM